MIEIDAVLVTERTAHGIEESAENTGLRLLESHGWIFEMLSYESSHPLTAEISKSRPS